MEPIGGGRGTTVQVIVKDKAVHVQTRLGLHGVRSLGVVMAPGEYAGMFVVRNEDIDGWQLVTSVYHAFRQTWHVLLKYGLDLTMGEKSVMAQIAGYFMELNLCVLGLKPGARIDDYRERVSTKAIQGANLIGASPVRPSKRNARQQLVAVAKGNDRRGRLNPGAAMARTIAGRNAILGRLEREIMRIDPHIAKRQRVLIAMIQLAEAHLCGTEDFVRRLLAFNGLKPVFQFRSRLVVAQQCEFYAQALARLDFHPYREACDETLTDLRLARDLLRAGFPSKDDVHDIRKILVRCRSALAILHQVVAVERIIYQMTRAIDGGRRDARSRWQLECFKIESALKAVDESSFRHPVCQGASNEAFSAAMLLTRGTATGKADTSSAREKLKKASAILSGIDHPNQ